MRTLSENWIAEGWIDFEYKKYLLLAYLQDVDKQFNQTKLYPPLADLIRHYQKLNGLALKKESIKDSFPKRISGIDLQKMAIKHKPILEDDELMKELEEIISFSIPEIKKHIEEGKSIYEFIESHLEIAPVGLSALYQKEGYVFFSYDHSKDIYIYQYKMRLFEDSIEKLRGIALSFLAKVTSSLGRTLEHIKLELAKTYRELPNPATWRVHCYQKVPLEESLLPVSKRMLMKLIE